MGQVAKYNQSVTISRSMMIEDNGEMRKGKAVACTDMKGRHEQQ
jgi:hypothetical protein